MTIETEVSLNQKPGWRFKCGVAIFVLKIVLALMIPLLAMSSLSAARIAAITGAIFITNKCLMILMIAVMGKSGFQELKQIIGRYVPNMKSDVMVGPIRHAVGLFMFCFPLVTAMMEPYVDSIWPELRPNVWQYQLTMDIMLIASIFVLGGNFWGKMRALFVRTARAVDAEKTPA